MIGVVGIILRCTCYGVRCTLSLSREVRYRTMDVSYSCASLYLAMYVRRDVRYSYLAMYVIVITTARCTLSYDGCKLFVCVVISRCTFRSKIRRVIAISRCTFSVFDRSDLSMYVFGRSDIRVDAIHVDDPCIRDYSSYLSPNTRRPSVSLTYFLPSR